jgi:metallothionein
MAAKEQKCEHPPCSCKTTDGNRYCSAECAAMEKTPDLGCLCGHAGCTGKIAQAAGAK